MAIWPMCFNPRARVGRDRWALIVAATLGQHFNPRARVGRDSWTALTREGVWEFQSTRPRGARPSRPRRPTTPETVSIHAPAWGATAECPINAGTNGSFNPRARVGRDVVMATVVPLSNGVSIHAPAWGATNFCRAAVMRRMTFQSTRPRGARPSGSAIDPGLRLFQSTRPRGARPPRMRFNISH